MEKRMVLGPNKETTCVRVEITDHIARVQLNRPDKHNGLDERMISQLIGAANSLRGNRDVRVVILGGEGASFCAGLDFKSVAKRPWVVPKLFFKAPWQDVNTFQKVASIWRSLPMPVIAVLHGHCFGGGLQIALSCDYRIAAPDAQLSIMEAKWGLVPDMGGTAALSRLTTLDKAFELTVTGSIFSGTEAVALGIVSRTHADPQADAMQMAEHIVQMSPDAVAAAKSLFQQAWLNDARRMMRWERWTQIGILGRFNQRAAMKNALGLAQKQIPYRNRTPRFKFF